VPVAYLCLRLKLPLIVGLMLTGMAIGPYGLGLIRDTHSIEILAEIGVMLLLFTIGLGVLPIGRLREMKRLVFLGGGLAGGAYGSRIRGRFLLFRTWCKSKHFLRISGRAFKHRRSC
jgi:CPA2 family monovalent cation:H+ antiporter-2